MDLKCGRIQNLEEVNDLLRKAPWSNEQIKEGYRPFLNFAEASKRAEAIVNYAKDLNIDWPLGLASIQTNHKLWVPCYEIPGCDFGADPKKSSASSAQKGHGIGLNWGSLLRLGRACVVGSDLFENGWATKIRKKLANPKDHLSTIEEMIWLSSWHNVTDIESEVQPWKSIGVKKSIDWKFNSCGQTINLEIKYRARDWVRVTDGPEYSIARPSYYEDVDGKFLRKLNGELNLVGISSYAVPDRSWREETHDYLDKNPQIDAIILWTPSCESEDGNPFEVQSRENADLVKLLLRATDEDKQHLVIVRHLWTERDKRKLEGKGHVENAKKSYAERAVNRILGEPPSGETGEVSK
jgi:hypothetical protein